VSRTIKNNWHLCNSATNGGINGKSNFIQ
jgi:hypothetical protein